MIPTIVPMASTRSGPSRAEILARRARAYTGSDPREALLREIADELDPPDAAGAGFVLLAIAIIASLMFVVVFGVVTMAAGSMDASEGGRAGTSIGARIEQHTPTYALGYWLSVPRP